MKASEQIYKAQEEIADILQRLYDETGLIPTSYDFSFVDVTTLGDMAHGRSSHILGERSLKVTGTGNN